MQTYDVTIIGAGIAGAGVAELLSSKNYSCLVLEQFSEPACGTSSKSSKLIHGGLRYLENFEFGLVKESLEERAYLVEHLPKLVQLKSFYIPLYTHSFRKPWMVFIGLSIYSLFSWRKFSSIPKSKWKDLDIQTKNLLKVYAYKDGVTDDKALTTHVLNTCDCTVSFNATVKKIEDFKTHCIISYQKEGISHQATSKVVINAAGSWVNEVLNLCTSKPETLPIDLVLGSHILVDTQIDRIYYIEAKDKRAIFVRPYHNGTLIGTTEVPVSHPQAHTKVPASDIVYLLDHFNHYFKTQITTANIIESFAGLRVLPGDNKDAFKKSREVQIHHDKINAPNVYSIYGGKLTTFRSTARKVFKKIKAKL
ncbi:MAG: FAD-dependent oxidoreductase [Epsilonproteobacteria bacterium]|nr:FAD-dependent oxidoreductase [Campylobacterota bacterium]